LSLLILPSFTSRCTIFGVRRPSLAQVRSQDSAAKLGMRMLKGLFVRIRDGLYLVGSLVLLHEEGPPYVEDGVANVDALLEESKMDDMEEAVLL
jgi:hypothetical protein